MSFPMKKGAGLAGLFILSIILLFSTEGLAQKRLRFKAETLKGGTLDGSRVQYLIDNVVIRQDETTIYADSAIVRKQDNTAEAFGNVRITEGDSVDIRAKRMIYGGGSGTARLREEVVYRDGNTVLYTDSLDYNKFDGIARYFGGGRMIDGETVLTSESGVFDKANQTARFYENVELRMDGGVVNSDTLIYNTETKEATFKGPTTVVRNDGSVTYAEKGLVYDTRSESTTVIEGEIDNPDYVITGDKLNYDQVNDVFTATGNVVMTSKTEDVVITGGHSVYDKKTGYTYVYDKPVMRRPVEEGDTLFLSADTLVAIEAEKDLDKRMLAYHDVRIYKNDLQGISDSLVYFFADSSIFFYQDPVLWNENSQLTGDTISVYMRNNELDRLMLRTNSYVITQDSIKNFNQVKGRQITAVFKEGELNRINVDGNAESLYFVLEEETNLLVGMNKISSGNMAMYFKDGLDRIDVFQNPEGKFMPPHEIAEPDKRLPGFNWRVAERPTRNSVLLRPPKTTPAAEQPQQEQPEKGLLPEVQQLKGPEDSAKNQLQK